jgi:hypothetical protein
MKTFEGTITIKWYKNDSYGDRRPITIDCEDRDELNKRLSKIKNDFMTKGDDPTFTFYKNTGRPYSISFYLTERK